MDITISPHNLKRFAASIPCLGKIGKDLYLSFDPLDGLTLSSLNEAKSAFGKFHFEPGFFEKCTTAGASDPAATSSSAGGVAVGGGRGNRTANRNDIPRGNQNHGGGSRAYQHYRTNNNDDDGENDNNDEEDQDDNADKDDARYVCRVPVRSIHSILRPRKGVLSLRIRSEGVDGDGNYFGLNRGKQGKGGNDDNDNANGRGRDRHEHRRYRGGGRSRSRDVDEYEEDDEDNTRRGRRQAEHRHRSGSYSSRERSRSRMRRKQNKNDDDNDNDDGDDVNGISHNTAKMMLAFEYNIECLTSKNNDNHRRHNHSNNQSNNNSANNSGGTFRVLHKVGVTDCNGISLSESISQRRTRSEIIAHPRLWLRLIDPLRRTPEMALTIDDELKVVTATSFHPMEVVQSGNGGGNTNAILQAAVARNAMLKTETSMGADEFDEFDFRNNRGKKKREKSRSIRDADSEEEDENGDGAGDEGTNDDEREEGEDRDRPPVDVNRKVILVFSIKEAKVSGLLSFTCLVYSIFKTD